MASSCRKKFGGFLMLRRLVVAVVLVISFVGPMMAQSVLNNDSITKMAGANLSDDVIVSMIKSQPGTYTVDPDSIIQLKKVGLSDTIIAAMIEKNSGGPAPTASAPTAPAAAPLVDEVGVYYMNKDKQWVEMLPEVVNWKTGGFLKGIATDGIVKGDVNGHIAGKTSHNVLNLPLDFLIYMPEGVAYTEYQMLHLRESGNSREFRSTTGGVIHASGGAQRDAMPFEAKQIAPRMYEVVLG